MKKFITIALLTILVITGCKKFLDEKSDKKLAIPKSLTDLQSLFNNFNYINILDPTSGEISAGDFYLDDNIFNSLRSETDRRLYTWETDHLFETGDKVNEWMSLYSLIYTANTVLEQLDKIDRNPTNAAEYDDIKGQAYFNRAHGYYDALTIWSVGYDSQKASSTPGIVIREGTDFNLPSKRSSTEDGYQYVVADLTEACKLLPLNRLHPDRPAKQAAYGYMARVQLSMGNFSVAGKYADSCLNINASLMDYNNISPTKTYPFARFNAEVIFESISITPTILSKSRAKIVPELFNNYEANDLRKSLFFSNNNDGTHGWRGAYIGEGAVYSALCVDEVLLIRAECNARVGKGTLALEDLNLLLSNRFKQGTFIPFTTSTVKDVTSLIIEERRKELVMRNLRWTDLKRLNILGNNINLQRITNGVVHTLPANDLRYALEIPEDIITRTGIPQNIR